MPRTPASRSRRESSGTDFFNANWERFRQQLMGLGNVICQRVNDGRRCIAAVYFFHHILEAEKHPQFALDWRNVVGVCRSCHPRPTDRDQGEYVPTLYRPPMASEPLPETLCQPGERVSQGVELWNVANRRSVLLEPDTRGTFYFGVRPNERAGSEDNESLRENFSFT